jgi:hypothetical protein
MTTPQRKELLMRDYLRYYDLERYLFEDVHERFHHEHSLGAFDFFSIIIWKANRAKSKMAQKLVARDTAGRHDLEAIVRTLTSDLYNAPDPESRLRILFQQWAFALPMASAVLTVLWPDDFTVYDYRVCDQLGAFHNLYYVNNFDRVWLEYCQFVERVRRMTPDSLSLRDKDRYLFGQSAAHQLERDIESCFTRTPPPELTS